MVREPVLECSFYVPVHRDADLSDGEPHNRTEWDWLDDQLYARFEGGTLAPDLYDGFYKDPDTGQRVDDKSHRFIVAVAQSKLDDIRLLLSEACTVFQQKCIYLSVAGKVEFVEAPKHDSS